MQITFAIPQTIGETDYDAGDVADLDDGKARELIRDGYARAGGKVSTRKQRAATPPEDDGPKPPPRTGKGSGVQEWVDYASANQVPVPEGTSRADIITLLSDRGVPTGEPATEPDEGDNQEEE